MNQMQAVKQYLLDGNAITSTQAFKLFGCTRLSDKIFRLRNKGMDIVTDMRDGYTRYGTPTKYAVYYLKGRSKL